jgi:hypothetical protein
MSGWVKTIKANWQKIYFLLSAGMMVFFYGLIVGKYEVFPYQTFSHAKEAAKDWLSDGNYMHYARLRPEKFIRPARQPGSGVTVYVPGKAYDGLTLITSMWDRSNGMELVAMDGTVLHKWRVSLNQIFPIPTSPDKDKQINDWDTIIHGTRLYPNGDVVFNFEFEGLVKVDRCSKVVWKLPFKTHHSIYEDAEKNLWVPGKKILNQADKRFPMLQPPISEEFILKVSPDGKVLEQTSILDILYRSGQESLLFANGNYGTGVIAYDLTHLNSIEVLEESIARAFPLFRAGDIMVSLRHLNLLAVIDPSTKKIKWSMTGPYIRQHDPHFLANGRISVFDNRTDDSNGKTFGGSRILSIDPMTRTVETIYKGTDRNTFYSSIAGKHQYLPNGNILIDEHDAGRVFEVTPAGDVVWSYVNRYDDDEVYVVTGGSRYPLYYGNFTQVTAQCQ